MCATWLIASIVLGTAPPLPLAAQRGTCREAHCTLAESDLASWLQLITLEPTKEDAKFEPEGDALDRALAVTRLLERHRHGHGGWPDSISPATLVERDSVACDPNAVLALYTASMNAVLARGETTLGWDVASILERNGRFELAENLLRATIPAASHPSKDDPGWLFLGRFLGRRGRYEEALWVFTEHRIGGALCGLGYDLILDEKLRWIERCCIALGDEAGLFQAWWRRLMNCKATGAAWQSADYFASKGLADPTADALRWFDSLEDEAFGPIPRNHSRGEFVEGLESWRRWNAGERPFDFVDASLPGGVELAISRAREIAASDPWAASRLLQSAAESGSPLAGRALLAMVADPGVGWKDSDRNWLRMRWREAILTRTFGCADPEDPATW